MTMDRGVPTAVVGQSLGTMRTEVKIGKKPREIHYEILMINTLGMDTTGVSGWAVVIIANLIQESIIQTQTGGKSAPLRMKEVAQRKDGGQWKMTTSTDTNMNQRMRTDSPQKNTPKGTRTLLNTHYQPKKDIAAGKRQKSPDTASTKTSLTTVSTRRTVTTGQ